MPNIFVATAIKKRSAMKQKTLYLETLEALQEDHLRLSHASSLNHHVGVLNFILGTLNAQKLFKELRAQLREKIVLDADRDVDYAFWAHPDCWMRITTPGDPLVRTIESASELPVNKDTREVLTTLANVPTEQLEASLQDVLDELRQVLSDIACLLQEGYDEENYTHLYEEWHRRYAASPDHQDALDTFRTWQQNYVGELDRNAYGEYFVEAFQKLMESGFLGEVTCIGGESCYARYCRESLFKLLQGDDRRLHYYAKFRRMMELDAATLHPIPKYVGKYIYLHRTTLDETQISAFFRSVCMCEQMDEALLVQPSASIGSESLHMCKRRATSAMLAVLEGCRDNLARGYDYNKVALAFQQMLGQTPTSLPLALQPLCTKLWDDYLLQRRRCAPEGEGGYIRATFLNIIGYWKSKGMFGNRTNAEVASLFYAHYTPADVHNVKVAITGTESLASFRPLLDYAFGFIIG